MIYFFPQRVSAMALVLLTVCATPTVSAFASQTTGDGSVMNVHRASMDIRTVLVSGVEPCMSHQCSCDR